MLVVLQIKVVERHLPNAREENLGAVADFGYPVRQVTSFFTCLECLVYIDYLLEALTKVAGPHLVIYVLVPNA